MFRSGISKLIETDLKQKMVFVSGPRQVGKTTLARRILCRICPRRQIYFNWDRAEHRRIIRNLAWSRQAPVAALDEIHKYPRWKQLIKGFYDTEGDRQRLLVTGSARLDIYKRGGESLVGRYVSYRLHPFSIGELSRGGKPPATDTLLTPEHWGTGPCAGKKINLEIILTLGGFPEPFLSGLERIARRWRMARQDQLLRQEMRDLTMIRHIGLVEHLVDLLRERVGSPLSINALSEDLQVSHRSIITWIEALERLYVIFRVQPYSGSLARTFRKEGKIYFWDWSELRQPGPRFENLVASHFLKLCHWISDVEGYRMDLCFVRDREKREVDFLLVKDGKPWVLAEAKLSRQKHYSPLRYFKERLHVPQAFQVVAQGPPEGNIRPVEPFFEGLP